MHLEINWGLLCTLVDKLKVFKGFLCTYVHTSGNTLLLRQVQCKCLSLLDYLFSADAKYPQNGFNLRKVRLTPLVLPLNGRDEFFHAFHLLEVQVHNVDDGGNGGGGDGGRGKLAVRALSTFIF